MDQDAPPVRPTAGWLLRELDEQLEAAAGALAADEPAHELACSSVRRAREALAQLQADLAGDDGRDETAGPGRRGCCRTARG